MRLLLDTHVWLWTLTRPERIGEAVLARLLDDEEELFLSSASGWEIAIKYALGRLPLPEPPWRYVPSRLEATGVRVLPVDMAHGLAVAELPAHHRDPFDRVLVAQARLEGMTLVTADPVFARYEVDVLWAGPRPDASGSD